MGESVSVILPIHRWHEHAQSAIDSVLGQTHTDFELIVVINGHDKLLASKIDMIKSLDTRINVLQTDRENLASALNLGIHHAEHDLIARMDSDDASHPNRLMVQSQWLNEHPDLAGCGTGAAFVDSDDQMRAILLPPMTPQQARWKLMVWNPFVHGSMMLRKEYVLSAGGYNEHLDRAQDYDLWLRLSERGLGGIPEVLYTHRLSSSGESGLDEIQSRVTVDRLRSVWASLPDQKIDGIDHAIQQAMNKIAMGNLDGRIDLERLMETHGPTQELLMAWMWSCAIHPIAPTNTMRRLERLRAGSDMLKSMGIERIWVWGAGDFGQFIIAHHHLLGVEIVGVLDDHRHGQRVGAFQISDPSTIDPDELDGAAAVIASDLYEDQIWESSAMLRSRGVDVLRLPDGAECPTLCAASANLGAQ